jgi:hypothetical protein
MYVDGMLAEGLFHRDGEEATGGAESAGEASVDAAGFSHRQADTGADVFDLAALRAELSGSG